jgi:hypothetical protein
MVPINYGKKGDKELSFAKQGIGIIRASQHCINLSLHLLAVLPTALKLPYVVMDESAYRYPSIHLEREIYIYMYVCVCVCVCVCVYTHIHTHTHIYIGG